MKTDKELLELAARAAGLNVKMIEVDQDDNFSGLIVGKRNTKEKMRWNPLRSDGDALRLAVNLCIVFNFIEGDTIQRQQVKAGRMTSLGGVVQIVDSSGWDAATRRAIVRAAAAIGEKL